MKNTSLVVIVFIFVFTAAAAPVLAQDEAELARKTQNPIANMTSAIRHDY